MGLRAADASRHAHHPGDPPGAYVPAFFSPSEFATLELLADLILPPDGDLAGARAAGAAEFLDFWVSQEPSLQKPFVEGLAAFEQICRRQGGSFATLHAEQQNAVLRRLAYRKHFVKGEATAQQFFALTRKYIVIGYYTSEAGFKALDSPFLTFYAESPGCAHPEEYHAA